MKIYTNHELNEYIKDNISDTWEERDFVAYARKYFHGRQDKIMAIGGLRGTGKTTGLLQAVNGLNACYITAQQKEEETADDYIDFIRNTDAKYIIIDEYSWINNREELDKYLYTAVQNGKRIAITGTESITLEYLNYNTLIHRVDMVHVTMFTYEEHCRLYHMEPSKKNREDYLLNGGLFSEYAVTNYETMQNYIKTAIIDNLAAYMGSRMSREKAAALVYSVLYKAICPSNLSTVPELAKNQLSVENFLSEMGIDTQIEFSDKDVRNVADIFEQIGLIVRVPNYDKTSPIKEQYYIANPSLSCQLILAAYDIKEISSDILGHMFEASAMIHVYNNKLSEHKLYFLNTSLQDGTNKELDIIVTDKTEEYAYLIECKYKTKNQIRQDTTIRSGYIEKTFFNESDILGRYVVYNGDPSIQTYNVGNILFIPIGNMLSKYYEFETNKKYILPSTSVLQQVMAYYTDEIKPCFLNTEQQKAELEKYIKTTYPDTPNIYNLACNMIDDFVKKTDLENEKTQ